MDAQQPTNVGSKAVKAGGQEAVSDYLAARAGAVRPKRDKLPSRKSLKRSLEEIVNKKEKSTVPAPTAAATHLAATTSCNEATDTHSPATTGPAAVRGNGPGPARVRGRQAPTRVSGGRARRIDHLHSRLAPATDGHSNLMSYIRCAQGEAVRNLLAGLIPPGALGRSSTSPLCRQSKETARAGGLLPLNTSGSRNWENSLGGVKRDLASHLHVPFSPGLPRTK